MPLHAGPATCIGATPWRGSCSHYLFLPERADATWWGEGGPAGILVLLPNASRIGSTTTGIKRPCLPIALLMRPKRRPMTSASATGASSSLLLANSSFRWCPFMQSRWTSRFLGFCFSYVGALQETVVALRTYTTHEAGPHDDGFFVHHLCVSRRGGRVRSVLLFFRSSQVDWTTTIRGFHPSTGFFFILLVSSQTPASIAGSTCVMVSPAVFISFFLVPTHRRVHLSHLLATTSG